MKSEREKLSKIKIFLSDYFEISEELLDQYGTLDICLNSDLPVFIDPFLLFASEKEEYQKLHNHVVKHLINLKDIAVKDFKDPDLTIFQFPEIKQNWFGLCEHGNSGRGLGKKFGNKLIKAFKGFYSNFGEETISSSSHIEKLTLFGKGIGKDFISDFTTNLILEFLLEYTENFAIKYLEEHQKRSFSVRCKFDIKFNQWIPREFILPYLFREEDGDYIILTPIDIITKDEPFISPKDLRDSFKKIANSIENSSLRKSINNYFSQCLPKEPKKTDTDMAIAATINKFPEIIDYYIREKEKNKEEAKSISEQKMAQIKDDLIDTLKFLSNELLKNSEYFNISPNSYAESLERVKYLKYVIEHNDCYRIFYSKEGKAIANEDTIQRIFKLTWFYSPYDVNSEVNNGRGPADYKISRGKNDSTIVEFKLGRSSSLKRNLENQTEIYKKASGSNKDIKVILCYTLPEISKVKKIVRQIVKSDEIPENIIIIDASPKESASKVV